MPNEEYLNQLLDNHAIAIEMVEAFVKDNKELFYTYNQLINDVNTCAKALELELKEVKEETTIGQHKRSFSLFRKVDSEKFVMAYPEAIQRLPQLVKEVDVKKLENAIKAQVVSEEAGRFIIEEKRWRTNPKPKVINLKLR